MSNPESTGKEAASPQAARYELRVSGMDCQSCAEDVTRTLLKVPGVQDVQVDIFNSKLEVQYQESKVSPEQIAETVSRIGYHVHRDQQHELRFIVDGLHCAEEGRQLKERLGPLPGVASLRVDPFNKRLIVNTALGAGEITQQIAALGMIARLEGEESEAVSAWDRHGRLIMTIVSGTLLGGGLLLDFIGYERLALLLLASATIAGAWFIAPRAVRAARSAALDMNFLMLLAAIGAALIGEWAEGASVVFLFSLAQLLESHSMDRARNAIKALMDLSPTEATVLRDGKEQQVPASEVTLHETIIIRPGKKVPLDGEVIAGRSAVNEAPITGESMPVDKEPGAEVFAGSINEQGLLEVRVTKLVGHTTLARIIHAVEEAQASKAPAQSFVDRFARSYTPAVVFVAFAVFLLPPLFAGGAWGEWFYRALAMLVIACPCALVISTPVSIVSGLAGAARSGILIKGGLHLENGGRVTVVAFDKTGTLTTGKPEVTDLVPLKEDHSETEVLLLAAALEQGSEHPLGRAIVEAAAERSLALPRATHFEAILGRGVQADIGDKRLYLGNERFVRELGITSPSCSAHCARLESEGKTVVILASVEEPLAVIALADRIRPEAKEAVAALREGGVSKILMLTGDNEQTAQAIAAQLQITDFQAGLLPQDKVDAVKRLEAAGERVGFVGDGINDAPALAASTVGIAMGAAGTDAALETADIALMADDLAKLPLALQFSRRTLQIIKQNITFSLTIKFVFLFLAINGWATLWMAVAADTGASLAVIANGLRALRTP